MKKETITKMISGIRNKILLFLLLAPSLCMGQMSGTVSLDPNGVADSTTFTTWYSFWRSLQGLSRNDGGPVLTAGVSGPVTVNVKGSNTSAETNAVEFPAISGMSATNTVTILGNGYELWYSSSYAAIRFIGGDYFTISDLVIRNSNTTSGGIWFNNQSDNNTISDCEIYLSNLTSTSSSTYYVALSTSVSSPSSRGSAATGTSGQPGSGNMISGCLMRTQSNSRGPYYAVTLNGNSANYTNTPQNNTFDGNEIQNFYYYGIYQYYSNGNIISNNDISRLNASTSGSSTMYGIYSYYPYCTGRSSELRGNKIHDLPFVGANTSNTGLSTFYGNYVYYCYGNSSNPFIIKDNIIRDIAYTTGSRYVNYIYRCSYVNVIGNIVENVHGKNTSSTSYDFYIYYPTAVLCNGNTSQNNSTLGYLYCFYIYYGSLGSYTWNEFQDNKIMNNTSVSYLYSAYIYYYSGSNSFKVNRNYVVGNSATSNTGYFYFYLYYLQNYQVCGNVVAGNTSNSKYIYIYSGLNGGYKAEIRNNTFQLDATNVPTPGSSYNYFYNYLYYHEVRYTGNIIDFRGPTSGTLAYYRYMYMYLSYSNPSNLKEFDYNTYYVNNQFQYPNWYINGSNVSDWAGFSNGGFAGAHDNGNNPMFIDPANGDYRPGAWVTQNNVPFIEVNEFDVNGNSRNKVKHDRGGLETPTDLEAVATNFTVPAVVCAGYTTGTTTLTVKSNYAYDLASNFNCSYSVNGGPKISAMVTKKLAMGDTATVTFPTPLTLNEVGNNRVAIYVDLPDDINSNDSFIFTTFVKPAPGGGRYVASAKPTQAVYQYTKLNDVTILGQPVIYNSASPRIYGNGTYGIDWVGSVFAITAGGNLRPGGEAKFTAPSGTSDLEVSYTTTDKNMEDSTIWVCLKISDLNNGCDTIIRRQVLIYPTVVPDFTFPTINCDGDNILFENGSKVRSGSMEFLWDFGTGNIADQTETPEPFFTFPASGTYTVKLTAKTLPYGFTSYDTALITIRPKPTAMFTHTNACDGFQLTFNSAGTSGTAALYWDFGDATGSTAANPGKKYAQTGNYLVTLRATENGCSEAVSKRVYQFENPNTNWKLLQGKCDNEVFTFDNTSTISSGVSGSYWDFDDGSVSTDATPEHLFNSPGLKNVKLTSISEFGCKDSLVKQVNVSESPKVSFANTSPCSLTPTEFTNNTPDVPGTYASYNWSFGDGGSSAAKSPVHQFKGLGPKNVTLKVILDNGCSAEINKDLIVNVQPKAEFDAANVCTGQLVVFENKTEWEQGEIQYNWNFGDGTFATDRAPKKDYNVSATTTYTVTLEASIVGGCSDQMVKQITINEGPKTCDFNAQADYASFFYGMKMEAIDANGQPLDQSGVAYTWVIEGGGNKSGASVSHNFGKDGTYNVTMIARVDATGCECTKTRSVVMNRSNTTDLESNAITVYPNPGTGKFQILLSGDFSGKLQIGIMSLNGAKMKTFEYAKPGTLDLDISDLADGVYIINLISENQHFSSRIELRR